MNTTEAIRQAYYAGVIAGKGTLVIYGECAERGTYHQFANLEMNGLPFRESREAVQSLTEYVNTALKSRGKTNRKRTFYLTRRHQEIIPLMDALGIRETFDAEWERVAEHDRSNGLKGAWDRLQKTTYKRLPNWETLTLTSRINLNSLDAVIMNTVVGNLMTENPPLQDLLINSFLEGTNGLCLGSQDLIQLELGRSILEQYELPA